MPLKHSFAARLEDIEPFRVVEVLARAKELEAAGRDIVHLEAGEPDFATIDPIIAAGQASLGRGETYYTQAAGIPQLRQAIAAYYRSDYGLDISPQRIMITPGASGALLLIAALLVNPGDGMLMTDPGYPCNRQFLRMVEGEGQLVPVGPDDGFQLTAAKAAESWQENTIGAMVASPANPTGAVMGRDALQALYDLVDEKNGYLVVDEIYHGLEFGNKATSILEITDDAFVMNSFSKYFGMTGWRLGWLVAPEAAVPELEKLAQNLFISMSTMAQHAALAGFSPESRQLLDERRDIFAQRRDFLVPALKEIGFEVPYHPDGAFYVYAGVEKFTANGQQFCLDMLEQHGVALTPGVDFGYHLAQQHIRFSYTTGMDRIEEAVNRLRRVLG